MGHGRHDFKPRLQFTLEPELYARVLRYHNAVGQGRTGMETVRELIWLGLTAAPETALVAAGRHWALRQAQMHIMRELSVALKRISGDLVRSSAEAEANLKSDIQFAIQNYERAQHNAG